MPLQKTSGLTSFLYRMKIPSDTSMQKLEEKPQNFFFYKLQNLKCTSF